MEEYENISKLTIQNDTKFLNDIRDMVKKTVQESNLNNADINKIALSVDEAVSNIIEHAYETQRMGTIDVVIMYNKEKYIVKIIDSGKSFNPNAIKSPDMLKHIKARKKKGLGIFLMRQIMDEVNYSFKEGIRNELVLVKYINK